MENAYLIAGLGNPGAEYAGTRHNVGFLAVDRFAVKLGSEWNLEEKFQTRLARAELDGRKLLLCEPQTYMNASGEAVRTMTDYFKVPLGRLLVVVDDADLPFGEIRLRARGSSGGHHGLESVEEHLATRNYARLRIGIGRQPNGVREITDYVLGRFEKAEQPWLRASLERACAQMECWLAISWLS